jgi:drug/metabolite transporter (DMT)-like permease
MIDYILLVCVVFANASLSLFNSFFQKKNGEKVGATQLYNLVMISSVFVTWSVIWALEGGFSLEVIPYSIIFGVGYSAAIIGLFNAIKCGPVALSTLILQLALIATVIWGFFFWDAEPTPLVIVGILLVCVSLVLCLYKGKGEQRESKINTKWIVYVSVCFFGNLICMIVQREQQRRYDGAYGNQLMLVAMICALLLSIVLYLRSNRADSAVLVKRAWFWPVLAGASNLLLNFFMMKLAVATKAKEISTSLIDPTIAVVPLAITTVISFLAFKEKLRWWQWVGIGVGIGASLLLSL